MNQINVVTIGKLIEAHRGGDEQKFKTHVDFIKTSLSSHDFSRGMKGVKNESIHAAYPQDGQHFFAVKACELRTIDSRF